jgi:23S rRNA (adenine1618-N6)-methyltransferase
MDKTSMEFSSQCLRFTWLVSKNDNLQPLHRILGKAKVAEHKAVEMAQG